MNLTIELVKNFSLTRIGELRVLFSGIAVTKNYSNPNYLLPGFLANFPEAK